jgi:flagellar basal body-associated protein FliL
MPVAPPFAAPAPDPNLPPPRKSRRALILSLVIVAVVFLLAVAGTGVVVFLNNAGDTTFPVNSCVKQNGGEAVKTSCSSSDAFTVVSKVDRQEDCPDQNQPFIVVQHKGAKDQVLCLRPAGAK